MKDDDDVVKARQKFDVSGRRGRGRARNMERMCCREHMKISNWCDVYEMKKRSSG